MVSLIPSELNDTSDDGSVLYEKETSFVALLDESPPALGAQPRSQDTQPPTAVGDSDGSDAAPEQLDYSSDDPLARYPEQYQASTYRDQYPLVAAKDLPTYDDFYEEERVEEPRALPYGAARQSVNAG